MKYQKTQERDHVLIDLQICLAKVAYCIKRYFETRNDRFLDRAIDIVRSASGYYREFEERIENCADGDEYLLNRELHPTGSS